MKLISMTDFVLEQTKEIYDESILEIDKLYNIKNYANFLKQKLEIWMFVPAKLVNGEWVVLEEPENFKEYIALQKIGGYSLCLNCREYQESKKRVLFEGFEFAKMHGSKLNSTIHFKFILHAFWYCSVSEKWNVSIGLSNLESILKYNLKLTDSAIKQIGL